MDYKDIFDQVRKEFGDEELALMVAIALCINLTTKPKRKDLTIKGRFSERVEKRIKETLWKHDKDKLEQALSIYRVLYDFEISNALDGLGGCKKKTLKELLDITH
jgi:hypothetical protein